MELPDIALAEPRDDVERLQRRLLDAIMLEFVLESKCMLLELYLETDDEDLLEALRGLKT